MEVEIVTAKKLTFNSFKKLLTLDRALVASRSSWLVNWFLLIVKLYVVISTNSKSVTASLADSAVDLASQAVLSITNTYMKKHSPNYPVGRSRLEALSVLGCACIMSMASVEVIQCKFINIIL